LLSHNINQTLPAFDNLNKELSSRFHLVDTFPNYFSFNIVKYKDAKARTAYLNKLKNVYRNSKDNPNTLFIITDASVKNNIAILVMHIWREQVIITKAIYYVMYVTSIEAKLFAIRYGINQAICQNS